MPNLIFILFIPFLPEGAAVLATLTLVHPNHIVCLCSWGLTYLPPTCNSKLFGYNSNQKRTTKPAWDSVFSISYAYFAYVCRLLPER
ncbi:hypothetical protein DLR67_16465 [Vibrio paracholerae]|nr:hypothetical protein DLR67_16465 [Vibrio paracholerae]RBM60133.1 hypothetical protein DLR71_15055 [Vibrio paracholerae]